MMLMTETPPPAVDDATPPSTSIVRKTRSDIAGTSTLWTGPQANPRRIRLTAPGNPVHR
jgi:hypothetical protein